MKELLPTAILVPSLNRPQFLHRVVENIHRATPEPHRILFCVGEPKSKAILDELGEWYLDDSDEPDKRYVTRMNKLIRHVQDEQTIFFGSDDVRHHLGWLTEALKVMAEGHWLVVVNDLRNPNGTQALIRKEYLEHAVFDSPGDAFHAGYDHNFADSEQFFTAYMQNVYARALSSYVEHLHPLFGHKTSVPWDMTYKNAMVRWEADRELFESRCQQIDALMGVKA